MKSPWISSTSQGLEPFWSRVLFFATNQGMLNKNKRLKTGYWTHNSSKQDELRGTKRCPTTLFSWLYLASILALTKTAESRQTGRMMASPHITHSMNWFKRETIRLKRVKMLVFTQRYKGCPVNFSSKPTPGPSSASCFFPHELGILK